MFKLNESKYKNAILFLTKNISRSGVRGRKKMYKLLYFTDFDFFEKYERPITGDVYHKIPMGPAPRYFDALAGELKKEGSLAITKSDSGLGYNDAYVYKAVKDPDLTVFDKEELQMLRRVVKQYGKKNGAQLEALAKTEPPYLAVGTGEEIPLELAHYRGKFSE